MNIFKNKCPLLGIHLKEVKAGTLTDICPHIHGSVNHRAKSLVETTQVSMNKLSDKQI